MLFIPTKIVCSVLPLYYIVIATVDKATEVDELTLKWVHPQLIHAAILWLPNRLTFYIAF